MSRTITLIGLLLCFGCGEMKLNHEHNVKPINGKIDINHKVDIGFGRKKKRDNDKWQ